MKFNHSKANNQGKFLRTSVAIAAAGLLAMGLSACDNNDELTANQPRMEEPMNNTQDNTQDTMPDTTNDNSSDTWITAKVKTELLADDISKGFDIEVNTVEGVVSLDGKVKDAESVMHVQQIVRDVEGVIQVDASGLMLEEARAY